MPGPIETLKKTRWWKPTLKRYAAHLAAIENLACPELRERFIVFASEVLNTPEGKRDDLLKMEPLERVEMGVRRYRQYEEPRGEERTFGTAARATKLKSS